MGYDLDLVRIPPGVDPREFMKRRFEEEDKSEEVEDFDANFQEFTPSHLAECRKVAQALIAADPNLDVVEVSDAELDTGCTSCLQISETKTRYGILISLFATDGGMSLPYWHKGAEQDAAFKKVREYAAIIERVGGYRVWDGQVGDFFDTDALADSARSVYGFGLKSLEAVVGNGDKKWWEFWKR